MKTQQELAAIVSQFQINGTVQEIKPLGNGLINDTFKVKTDGPEDYVLQRVNNAIFQDVDLLQSNIEAVTRHIRGKLEAAGESDIDRKVLRFVPVKGSSKTYWTDGQTYWRISVFIRDAFTYETVNLPARRSGILRRCWPIFPTSWARPSRISTTWNCVRVSCGKRLQPMQPGGWPIPPSRRS